MATLSSWKMSGKAWSRGLQGALSMLLWSPMETSMLFSWFSLFCSSGLQLLVRPAPVSGFSKHTLAGRETLPRRGFKELRPCKPLKREDRLRSVKE